MLLCEYGFCEVLAQTVACLTLDLTTDGLGYLHDRADQIELYDDPSIPEKH